MHSSKSVSNHRHDIAAIWVCILLMWQRFGCGQVAADWEAEQAKRAEMQRLADELRGL